LTDRARRIEAFLDANAWRLADMRPLADDASFRSYHRLRSGARRAVLMDAPPEHEDVRPFVGVARHLLGLGLSAPRILAEDAEAGLLLLEDLGDDTFTRLLAAGADETELYALAVDVLVHLHRLPPSETVPAGLPPYDTGRLLAEALLLPDWFVPAALGAPPPDAVREAYVEAWTQTFPAVLAQPATLVLRDFHVDNLMRLPDRRGVAACGLLDFQDAVAGAAAYDVMSLLEDARRDVAPGLKDAMLNRYFEAVGHLDRTGFEAAFAILAAQRHAKVIGIFTRLCVRDGKAGYLAHIPRVWRLLERALRHPALAPVSAWFDDNIPPDARGIPACRPAEP
jgi:aminoglycoside/choline kinase family phosphotransferase